MINIDDLIGVRYQVNGRSLKTGMDCYGLAIEVCKRMGHVLPDPDLLKKHFREFEKCEELILNDVKVKQITEPCKEGDLILIKNAKGVVGHIGVYLDNGRFIHCNKDGVHIEKLIYYKNLIGRVYTWL